MVASRVLVVFAVLALALAPAIAGPKDDARKLVASADINYNVGKFDAALAEYTKAYELFPVPPLLFNIGQCYRQLQNYERAVFFYEGYLRESPPDAPNRELVEGLVRDARAALDNQRASQAKADEDRARAQAERERQERLETERLRIEAEERRRASQPDPVAEARRAQADKERRERDVFYRKWWFWSAVGGAVAIAGTAYYFSGDTTVVQPSGSLGGLDRR